MADYKTIKGTKIQNYTTDPDNPLTGQVWYNETDQVLKTFYVNPGSWATGGDINTARNSTQGSGTISSAIAFGGNAPPGAPSAILTETYNGTSWTEVNDLNTGRLQFSSAGTTQDAALAIGGFTNLTETETWNGTSWTEVNDLNTGRQITGSAGTNTAALTFGGDAPPSIPEYFAGTESWNGTSWTEVNDLNAGRFWIGGCGTQTAALGFGGDIGPPATGGAEYFTGTESWNGTSWTEVNDLNTGRRLAGGAGTQTDALVASGAPVGGNFTESWNGTSWTEVADMILTRGGATGSFGTANSALMAGGYVTDFVTTTEEWTAGPVTKTITSS